LAHQDLWLNPSDYVAAHMRVIGSSAFEVCQIRLAHGLSSYRTVWVRASCMHGLPPVHFSKMSVL